MTTDKVYQIQFLREEIKSNNLIQLNIGELVLNGWIVVNPKYINKNQFPEEDYEFIAIGNPKECNIIDKQEETVFFARKKNDF